jgi:hypothetical protein
MRALAFQKGGPQPSDGNACPEVVVVSTLDQAAFGGFFPYGKPRTRSAPRVNDFGIGSRPGTDPFEQVKDQGVDGIGHKHHRFQKVLPFDSAE